VVRSLEAVLWALYRSNSFREGALRAVNLGMRIPPEQPPQPEIFARQATQDGLKGDLHQLPAQSVPSPSAIEKADIVNRATERV